MLHDDKLSRAVASCLTRVVFVEGDVIIHEGEEGRGMYFIHKGCVDVLRPIRFLEWERAKTQTSCLAWSSYRPGKARAQTAADLHLATGLANAKRDRDAAKKDEIGDGSNPEVLTTLRERAFFGEMALINPRGVALASVRANVYAECYHLSSTDYAMLLERFPDFKSYLEGIAKLRIANSVVTSAGGATSGVAGAEASMTRKLRTRDELIRRSEHSSTADVMAAYAGGEIQGAFGEPQGSFSLAHSKEGTSAPHEFSIARNRPRLESRKPSKVSCAFAPKNNESDCSGKLAA